jgi:pimeloyl-ACP methyl ester carboxylesterase
VNRRLKRIALWLAVAIVVAVVAAAGLQALLSHLSLRNNLPPGRLVELNGGQVHLLCAGEGSPTVILEAGAGSLAWMSVFSEIAQLTRVCTYDRPGHGWSEPTNSPRSAETMVQELKVLLQTTEIEPPYILAGHSFGGVLMQLYAARFPDDFEGVVLVDSSHPDQLHHTSDLEELDRFALLLRVVGPLGLARMLLPALEGDPESRDITVREQERELLMTNRTLRTIAKEMSSMRQSLREVGDSAVDFGNKPLIVLTQGRRRAEFWHRMQEDLSRLSTNSEWQVVDDAGHFIQHDRPDVVVDAFRRVIEKLETTADSPLP